MKKTFYITTTIPYVNAEPHIGFALEVIQADTIARFKRLTGFDVIFNTGTDENGLKIYQKAQEQGKDPQKYCDEYAIIFGKLKDALDLSYTNFARTTDPKHKKACQEFWKLCDKNGFIDKKLYKIRYCVGCELEKTDSELEGGKCPLHPNMELQIYEEENYFFKFSQFQNRLLDLYEKEPTLVVPDYRLEEIRNFVKAGLEDFSISRLKSKLPWGVDVPGDPEHVMYVWFDALVNYISTLGWPNPNSQFKDYWPVVQIAGKDNLRQQSAMWQAMLMAAGLPQSKQILIHGFITSNGQKMSKSLGNVVNPFDLVKDYGTEAVRYYLLREIPTFSDGDFSHARFKEIYNADLANGLGNLVSRVAKLAQGKTLKTNKLIALTQSVQTHIEKYNFNKALDEIWKKITRSDVEINKTEPWKLPEGKEKEEFLSNQVNALLQIAFDLQPFLPKTSSTIVEIFGETVTTPEKPLFPRL